MAVTWNYRESAGGLSCSRSLTKDAEIRCETSLTNGQTDKEISFSIPHAQVYGIAVECPGDLKIETNATDASGGNTINVPAGGFVYLSGGVPTKPVNANITKIYVTDMSSGLNAADDSVKISMLVDLTP